MKNYNKILFVVTCAFLTLPLNATKKETIKPNEIKWTRKENGSLRNIKKVEAPKCAICMQKITPYQIKQAVCRGHNEVYHVKCIKRSVKIKKECPICRAKIDKKTFQYLENQNNTTLMNSGVNNAPENAAFELVRSFALDNRAFLNFLYTDFFINQQSNDESIDDNYEPTVIDE